MQRHIMMHHCMSATAVATAAANRLHRARFHAERVMHQAAICTMPDHGDACLSMRFTAMQPCAAVTCATAPLSTCQHELTQHTPTTAQPPPSPPPLVRLDSRKDGVYKQHARHEAERAHAEVHAEHDDGHVREIQQHREAVHGGEAVVEEDKGVDEEVDGDGAAAVERAPPPEVVLRAQLHVPARGAAALSRAIRRRIRARARAVHASSMRHVTCNTAYAGSSPEQP